MYLIKQETKPTLLRFKNFESKLRTNICKNENEVILSLIVPGFEKKEISISINKESLIVEGNRNNKEETNFKYSQMEFSKNDFKKEFSIPSIYDTEKIEAILENGILEIAIPINQKLAQPKKINIQ